MSKKLPSDIPIGADFGDTVPPEDLFDTLFLYKELRDEGDSHPTQVGPYTILHLIEEGGMARSTSPNASSPCA